MAWPNARYLFAQFSSAFPRQTASKEVLSSLLHFPFTKGVAGHVAETGTAVRVSDANSDPRFSNDVDRATGFTYVNLLLLRVEAG